MIAKATKPGRNFGGIIDYLFDGKLAERGRAEKKAEVILHSPDLRIPRDSDDLYRRSRLKADFTRQVQSSRGYKNGGSDQK